MNVSLLLSLAFGTLVSEDLACLAAGLLIADGRLDPLAGLLACGLGIWVGDLGLWGVGRVAGAAVLGRWSGGRLDGLRDWFARRGGVALLAARFLPGTRLPLYLLSGVLDRRPTRFAVWTLLAVVVWVPAVVLLVALAGEAAVGWVRWLLAGGLLAALGLRLAITAATRHGRTKLVAAVSTLWRWEFWPAWLFYLPLVPYLGWLAVRHRGATVWTAANPGIPGGGVVGESKAEILARLPADAVIPFALVPAGPVDDRVARLEAAVAERGWAFPLVLKPDAGQRGAGVRRVADWAAVESYLSDQPAAVLAQPYHPGPHEAGVFYYRHPGAAKGHILAVTDKVFPVLVGDGVSPLADLIWRHPRYRMQAATFLARHDPARVLAAGERLQLALAGNHCQGTLFRDGGHLLTPELESAIDALAQAFPGFHFGRFDVRYPDKASLRAGRHLAIVELNGVTSEATSLYDPARSLRSAYHLLFRQWATLFAIGAAQRGRGVRPLSVVELVQLVWRFYRDRPGDLRAD